jgi:hypothetical protein
VHHSPPRSVEDIVTKEPGARGLNCPDGTSMWAYSELL